MNAHQEGACADLAPHPPLPASEAARDETFVIPLFDGLSEDDQDYVIEQLRALATRRRSRVAAQ